MIDISERHYTWFPTKKLAHKDGTLSDVLSYSQHGEDITVIQHFMPNIKNVKDGTYFEVGAYDGVLYSNTKLFESYFNFSGILVEPSSQFNQLKINRKGSNNTLYNCAIHDSKSEIEFLGNSPLACSIEAMSEEHYNTYSPGGIAPVTQLPNISEKYIVPAKRVSNIITDANVTYIDYFSIDVEGSEINLLNSIDWDIPIYVISIETIFQTNEVIADILTKNKFKRVKEVETAEHQQFWVNDTYFRKDILTGNYEK